MKCWLCQEVPLDGSIELHHLTYKRVGRESLDDLMPLCGVCHKKVHLALSLLRRTVEFTHEVIEVMLILPRLTEGQLESYAKERGL